MGRVAALEPLADSHDVSRFSSGVPGLDIWLQDKERLNEAKGGARTYVACDGDRMDGVYSLAASAVERRRVDINTIRAWLGHVNINTTNIYAEIDLEMKARALALCDAAEPGPSRPWKKKKGLMAFLKSL